MYEVGVFQGKQEGPVLVRSGGLWIGTTDSPTVDLHPVGVRWTYSPVGRKREKRSTYISVLGEERRLRRGLSKQHTEEQGSESGMGRDGPR